MPSEQVLDLVVAGSLDWSQPERELPNHAAAAKLRIEVTSAGFVLTKALRGEVRRRVLLSLSRFGPEVHDVTARLADCPNPLGGVDRRCRVRARLRSGLVLRAEAVNGQIESAVGRSAVRLALLVNEALDGRAGRLWW
jgi:putative sigma-54 modulation protein